MSSIQIDLQNVDIQHGIDASNLTERMMLHLTREIAMEMRELPDILDSFGMSWDQYKLLAYNPKFGVMLREQMIMWGGAQNVEQRIRAKMQHMVEESLPELYKELVKEGLTTAKVELVKTLMKGGSIGVDVRDGGPQAERVNITINMGAEKSVAVSQPLATIDHEAEDA